VFSGGSGVFGAAFFIFEVMQHEPVGQNNLDLEQYQCRRCGRLFYINGMDRSSLDLDFGCPFGCDDNGRHVRDLHAEIKEVTEVVPCEPG